MNIFEAINLGKVVQTGSDGIRRGGHAPSWEKASEDELRIDQAKEYALEFLADKENRLHLKELRAEYLHAHGWSKDKTFKSKIEIPSDVYLSLPNNFKGKENAKRLRSWIRTNFPAFDLSWHG
jgi:hypothetical protein